MCKLYLFVWLVVVGGEKSNSVVAVVLSLLEYYIEFGLMRFLFQLFHRLPFENILLI